MKKIKKRLKSWLRGLKVCLTLKKSFSFFPSPALNKKKKKETLKILLKKKLHIW
jgi:hypothetical protein